MFGVICDCVGIDTRIITEKQRGQVAQAAKVLSEAGYTVTDLMAFRKYWFTQDWRGSKRHEWPTLSQLREELGKVKAIPYLPAAADPPQQYRPSLLLSVRHTELCYRHPYWT